MSSNLSYLEKKNIINSILAGLSGTIKSFNITIDNFSIIVIKVMEILKNYPELTPANKYQLSIDILLKIINNLELDEQHQIYLLGTVHSMVFDLADINTRINNNIAVKLSYFIINNTIIIYRIKQYLFII